jgi:hypothetical protein
MPLSEADRKALEAQRARRRAAGGGSAPAGFTGPSPATGGGDGEFEFGEFTPPLVPPDFEPLVEEEEGPGLFARGFSAVFDNPVARNLLSGEEFINTAGGLVGADDLGTDIRGKLEEAPVIGGALGLGFDVAASPLTLLTAGGGGAAASALRGFGSTAARQGTIRGFAARGTAGLIEPITAGNVGQRFAAETILGTAGEGLAIEAGERLPLDQLPGPARVVATLGIGAAGGITALRTTRRAAPSLVGRMHVVSPAAATTQENLDTLAGRNAAGHTIADVVGNKSVDEAIEASDWRIQMGAKYEQAEGWGARLARLIAPSDPTAHAIVGEFWKRGDSASSYINAQVERLQPRIRENFEFDAEGRVTNVALKKDGSGYDLNPAQQETVDQITTMLDEQLAWMKANGVEVEEITGEALEAATEVFAGGNILPDRPMFGDMVERLGAGKGHYFPRAATEVGGIDIIRRRADPTRQRVPGFSDTSEHLALMEENMARGTKYEADPARLLHDNMTAVADRVNGAWLKKAVEQFGETPNAYIDRVAPGLRLKGNRLNIKARRKRDQILRAVARRVERTRAKKDARRQYLRARKGGRTLNAAETRELEVLERLERLQGTITAIPQIAGVTARGRRAALRNAQAAERRVEDIFTRTNEVRHQLDEGLRILDEAEAAEAMRKGEVDRLRNELNNLRVEQDSVNTRLTVYRDKASHPRNGQAFIPRLAGSTSFNADFAREIEQALAPQSAQGLQGAVNSFNRIARISMATMDLSFVGIQGLLTMGTHPVAAAQAFLRGSASLFGAKGERFYLNVVRKNGEVVDDFIRHGGHWANEDQAGEFILGTQGFGGRLASLPGVKQTNLAFSRTGNLFRMELWRNATENASLRMRGTARGKAHGISAAERRRVADAINSMTGHKSGRVSSWEETILFAPRFFRSQLDVVQRAFRTGADADLARLALFRTMAMGAMFTVLANSARGIETDWNPVIEDSEGNLRFNSNFARIKGIGGQDVSVFGSWDSLLGLMVTGAVAGPIEGVERLLRTKASPAVSTVWDIAVGEDFSGETIDVTTPEGLLDALFKETVNKLPFTIQDGIEGFEAGNFIDAALDGDVKGAASAGIPEAALFNFFGGKSSPTTPFEDRDQMSMDLFGRHWVDLTGDEQKEVTDTRPQVFERIKDRDEERAAQGDLRAQVRVQKRDIDETRMAEELSLLRQLVNGDMQAKAFDDEMGNASMRAFAKREALDELLDIEYKEGETPETRALSNYYDLRDLAKLDGTQAMNWELFEELERSFLAGLSDSERRFVEERKRTPHPPELDWYTNAKEFVQESGYYDTIDAAFSQVASVVQGIDPEITSFNLLLARMDKARRTGDTATLERLNDVRRVVDKASRSQKELLRANNPGLENALLALGRITTRIGESSSQRTPSLGGSSFGGNSFGSSGFGGSAFR